MDSPARSDRFEQGSDRSEGRGPSFHGDPEDPDSTDSSRGTGSYLGAAITRIQSQTNRVEARLGALEAELEELRLQVGRGPALREIHRRLEAVEASQRLRTGRLRELFSAIFIAVQRFLQQ